MKMAGKVATSFLKNGTMHEILMLFLILPWNDKSELSVKNVSVGIVQ